MADSFWTKKRVLVTGANGFVGRHLVAQLTLLNPLELRTPRSAEFDFRQPGACAKAVKGCDVVIHLAANVGGIGYNQHFPGTLFYDNILMGVHLIEEARKAKVDKFIGVGTICEYPKHAHTPFSESELWSGYPEETNAPYGLAKKMMIVQGTAYRQQYGFNSIHLLPVNMYGPGDNFDLESSHVVPALIRKFLQARDEGTKEVTLWGTGSATREFLYVADAVKGIILAAEHYDSDQPVNLGSGMEISIKDLATLIKKKVGYKGKIIWDTSKPDGQPRRQLDVSKAKEAFNFQATTDFDQGLTETIAWYEQSR